MTERLQSILEAEELSSLLEKFNGQGVTDSILGDLTDSDLKELGVDKLGERKRLLAAFAKSGGGVTVLVVEESSSQTSGSSPLKTAATPAEATRDSPWVNTLGIPFVPIPRFDTRFCIWPVRVQDYEAYCMASGAQFPEIPFSPEPDHPIVGVSWNDAIEFCIWLTGRERSEGKIDEKTVYRLPTDLEWSAAVGLPHEPEATPAERHLKAPGYPWGLRWPPPRNAGNYEDRRDDQWGLRYLMEDHLHVLRLWDERTASIVAQIIARGDQINPRAQETDERNKRHQLSQNEQIRRLHEKWKSEWKPIDNFEFTSPVSAFNSSETGIFGLGGNIWEWCMDSAADDGEAILRGASYAICWDNAEDTGISIEVSEPGKRAFISPDLYFQDMTWSKVTIPLSNQDVYRSSYRSRGAKMSPVMVSMCIDGAFRDFPTSGIRLELSTG